MTDVTITFSRSELANLLALIDAGIKVLGRPAVRAAATIDAKIEMALQTAQTQEMKSSGAEARP